MTENRFFLGVENSATGRAWRDRLDERGSARALAIAQRHDLPELLARILAGRNVEADAVDAFLDPTIKRSMPDPHVLTAMKEAAERIADAVTRSESDRHFRRLRRRRRDLGGAVGALSAPMRHRSHHPHSRPAVRGLRPECRGRARARGARRDASGLRRLRHHQHRAACGGQNARRRRRRHRSPPGRRGIAAGGRRSSIRTGATISPGLGHLAAVGLDLHDGRCGQPGAARARLLDRGAAGARSARACSTTSRSAPSPTWCRSSD